MQGHHLYLKTFAWVPLFITALLFATVVTAELPATKPLRVVFPGVLLDKTNQSNVPFRVLNAPVGATYQFWESTSDRGPGFPLATNPTPRPLPAASKIDPASGSTVSTIYVDLGDLDISVRRVIILQIFDQNGNSLASTSTAAQANADRVQHHHALNAFYVNRAGQNIVDYPSGISSQGVVRAGGNLFQPEYASIRSTRDAHGNAGLNCAVRYGPACLNVNVSGGWFDAGDQGKYVQNGAVALWHLFNLIEKDMSFLKTNPSDTSAFASQQRNLWRASNANSIPTTPDALTPGSTFIAPQASATELPNIVKEARYEMEWLLRMQITEPSWMISVPLGNQDIIYDAAKGYGLTPVKVFSLNYKNYLADTTVEENNLRDPGSNIAVPLYRQVLKYTPNLTMDGMVFHSVHDEAWTAIPMLPANNPMKRVLEYPTTAATLSFAAVAAQCYRVFKVIDPTFANTCWNASTKAYNAAYAQKKTKDYIYFYGEYSNASGVGPLASIVNGGGAYADYRLDDLLYWARIERYLTTVAVANGSETAEARDYLRDILNKKNPIGDGLSSPGVSELFPMSAPSWLLAYNWNCAAALGSISAITVAPQVFAKATVEVPAVEGQTTLAPLTAPSPAYNLITYVNKLAVNAGKNAWLLPLPSGFKFEWGSNHEIVNAGIFAALATLVDAAPNKDSALPPLAPAAKQIPQNIVYYMLGSNPLKRSMVTGQNTGISARNIHHRVFAKQADASTIATPAGWLVGGPNGQIAQSVLSASREMGAGQTNDLGVFNGGVIKNNNAGEQGGYNQLMRVLRDCREANATATTTATVRSALCYLDDYKSYHTNEVAINWQASWLWLSSYVRP